MRGFPVQGVGKLLPTHAHLPRIVMQNTRPAPPLKPLLALGLAVLALHLWLLQFAPLPHLSSSEPPFTGPLVVRPLPLEPRPVPAPAAQVPPRARPAKPVRPPATATAAETPTPAADVLPPQQPPTPSTAELPGAATTGTAVPDATAAASEPAAAPTAPPSYAVPGSTRLKYTITGTVGGLNYFANGELLWRHDGERYDARLEIGAFLLGSRVQTSRGRIGAQGLEPKRFSDKVRSEVAAHFDYDKGKIIFSANTPETALLPGAQDQLSVFIQLASLFAGEPDRHPVGSTLELQAVGAREASLWRFTVDGPEPLRLPGGEQATLKLTRLPSQAHDLKAEIWLAPALGYLPVRIRLSQDNGDVVDQQWNETAAP